jgi:hypothetical protein
MKTALKEVGETLAFIVEQMATKDDLKHFATKEDLKGSATKEDVREITRQVVRDEVPGMIREELRPILHNSVKSIGGSRRSKSTMRT